MSQILKKFCPDPEFPLPPLFRRDRFLGARHFLNLRRPNLLWKKVPCRDFHRCFSVLFIFKGFIALGCFGVFLILLDVILSELKLCSYLYGMPIHAIWHLSGACILYRIGTIFDENNRNIGIRWLKQIYINIILLNLNLHNSLNLARKHGFHYFSKLFCFYSGWTGLFLKTQCFKQLICPGLFLKTQIRDQNLHEDTIFDIFDQNASAFFFVVKRIKLEKVRLKEKCHDEFYFVEFFPLRLFYLILVNKFWSLPITK